MANLDLYALILSAIALVGIQFAPCCLFSFDPGGEEYGRIEGSLELTNDLSGSDTFRFVDC